MKGACESLLLTRKDLYFRRHRAAEACQGFAERSGWQPGTGSDGVLREYSFLGEINQSTGDATVSIASINFRSPRNQRPHPQRKHGSADLNASVISPTETHFGEVR